MNDRELADLLVALGIGDKLTLPEPHFGYAYQFPAGEPDNGCLFLTDESFVCDWRVVGAVMEHFPKIEYQWGDDYDCVYVSFEGDDLGHLAICIDTDSLPRALCEACVKALQLERGDIV